VEQWLQRERSSPSHTLRRGRFPRHPGESRGPLVERATLFLQAVDTGARRHDSFPPTACVLQNERMKLLVPGTGPAMASMFRLQFEPTQDSWVLLSPDGMVKLNTPAAEILRRCDGRHSVDDIVCELEIAFEQQGLLTEVSSFIELAQRNGWLQ
jgi:pyrroloquinoline quinone biosynthesis protein D